MKDKKSKISKHKKYSFFNIGTIMFGVLFVYMVICLVLYLQTEHVTAYEVTAGPLTGNYRYTALTLKSEVLVKASQSGTVSYYAREGQKVGMGNGVCSVDVSGKQRDIVKNMEAGLTGDNPEMILKLRSQMSTFAMNYDSVSYQAVYNFRSDVESSILELANVSSLSDPEAWGIENLYTAPQEGIVDYSMDGYENMQAESVKQADFDQMAYQKTNFRVNGTVSNGDCLYKLLTDEKWSLLFPVNKEMESELDGRKSIRFRFLKDGTIFSGDFSILHNNDGSFGKIDMETSLIRYSGERFLEIELLLDRTTGLKIPNSAIANKTFYKIPKEFATYDGEKPKEISIVKQIEKKDGSKAPKYVTATVYKDEKAYFLIDSTQVSDGDVILADEKPIYTISDSETLEGVYNINKGYAVFREITILDKNEEYCIIEEGATFGLSEYDHIALDASTVNDQDIIAR